MTCYGYGYGYGPSLSVDPLAQSRASFAASRQQAAVADVHQEEENHKSTLAIAGTAALAAVAFAVFCPGKAKAIKDKVLGLFAKGKGAEAASGAASGAGKKLGKKFDAFIAQLRGKNIETVDALEKYAKEKGIKLGGFKATRSEIMDRINRAVPNKKWIKKFSEGTSLKTREEITTYLNNNKLGKLLEQYTAEKYGGSEEKALEALRKRIFKEAYRKELRTTEGGELFRKMRQYIFEAQSAPNPVRKAIQQKVNQKFNKLLDSIAPVVKDSTGKAVRSADGVVQRSDYTVEKLLKEYNKRYGKTLGIIAIPDGCKDAKKWVEGTIRGKFARSFEKGLAQAAE